jgi:ubiquinone/menaquinone biosynthesis C-methylase UbiE
MSAPKSPNFDAIARAYRWMEYLSFGGSLQRCRTHFLPQLMGSGSALVFGDGDGRFLAALLAANPALHADAVDSSAAMLRLLERRAHASTRLRTHLAGALDFTPNHTYDLVATHFFLDCLTTAEIAALCVRITPHLASNARWVISDFHIPSGPMRWPARILVRWLYLAFRILTGLRVTHLPDHRAVLATAGFVRAAQHYALAGVLTAELWEYTPAMQLPPQRPKTPQISDPVPDPEPASPSLPGPDPGVFHPDPAPACPEDAAPPLK